MPRLYSFFLSSSFRALICALVLSAIPLIAQKSDEAGTSAPSGSPNPVANTYIVGEADVLRINVWKQPEISQQSVVVRPDGMVTVPLVGEVKVSGMTPVQIETSLVESLKQYVNEPHVTVTVVEVGSKTVYVTGEVQHPGAYPLVGPVDVLQIIAKAGGVTPYAHRRSVFVLRQVNGKKEKLPVNYNQIFHGKNPEQNITLQPGDTVVVP
jgi:polysaccharide export outer membrane protein